MRLAAQRFLADLDRAKGKGAPFSFDRWHAEDACRFIELLPHVEGEWTNPDGSPQPNIVLHPAHVFFLVNLFGFRKPDGSRRFTTATYAVARKNAKALALDTPIPTPAGWATMGDLVKGDLVYGADGRSCRVTQTSPIYTDHDCYRLRFSNGEEVIADAGHKWLTTARVDQPEGKRVGNRRTRTRTRTTREIFDTLRYGLRGDVNHSVEMPEPLHCAVADLPVAPYTLGAWLGDGYSACARLTCDRADAEILDGIRADGWPVREKYVTDGKASTFVLSDGDRSQSARNRSLAATLRGVGVIGDKHIPAAYLRASRPQRMALLQGLMDTDGTISKNGRVLSYCGVNERLVDGVAELLSSLGVKYSWRRNPLTCNGRSVPGVGHLLQFMAFRDDLPVFRLRRKLERMRLRSECTIAPRSRTVQIVDVERVDSVPVRCITVDSPDHLFLFGKTMLPTHNSTLAAGIMLYCQLCEGEVGPQVVSAATTGAQARIVFNIAKRMVEKTPALQAHFGVQVFANSIASYDNGGSFKPINAKASTQDGLNPSAVEVDEVHAHQTHDLLNVLKSAAGARRNPLFLFTTTEGYENPGPWQEQRTFARQVLAGVITADHFLAVLYAVDDDDDEFDESAWRKANPLMDVNPLLLAEIRKEAIEAKGMPGRLAEFRIKRLNRQSSTATGHIDLPKWNKCDGPVDVETLKGTVCYGALDLAATQDLVALVLIWRADDGKVYVFCRFWVPSEAIKRREARGVTPYAAWAAAGLLTVVEGEVVDYDAIEADVVRLHREFGVTEFAYDPWNATQLVARLIDQHSVPMVEFVQGFKSYHPAMQELDKLYAAGNLVHGGNPVLRWNAANLVAVNDENKNMKPSKKRSADKIDGMCALLMALGISQQSDSPSMAEFFNNPIIIG